MQLQIGKIYLIEISKIISDKSRALEFVQTIHNNSLNFKNYQTMGNHTKASSKTGQNWPLALVLSP
jgi:hypothetical protein